MTNDDSKRLELFNPLASFYVEGEPDDPDSYIACVDLYGEGGERVQIQYPSSQDIDIFGEMLMRASNDLEYAEDNGIEALANKVGYAQEDTMLTVEDILNHPNDND